MDRRSFLKNTGWSFLGLAASGSLLGSCVAGSKEAKKIMPSASNLKVFWGDLHNHCNLTYGHGDMRDAFEAAKGQLDFVSVTPHAMWPDIPGANDPRLKWVIDYHTGAFKRLREGGERLFVRLDRGAVARRYGEVVLLFDGLFGLGLSGLRIFLARVSACAQQNACEHHRTCYDLFRNHRVVATLPYCISRALLPRARSS